MIKESPILFSTGMVKSIIAGTKIKTRRILAMQPDTDSYYEMAFDKLNSILTIDYNQGEANPKLKFPYGKVGDILWVREMLYQNGELGLEYVANKKVIDESIIPNEYGPYGGSYSFRNIPSIHMPKWAARIWLEITDIKVEKLQEISDDDVLDEGVGIKIAFLSDSTSDLSLKGQFKSLWSSINGIDSWNENPYVWVISFKVLSTKGKPKHLSQLAATTS